jgi:hypothetical protein
LAEQEEEEEELEEVTGCVQLTETHVRSPGLHQSGVSSTAERALRKPALNPSPGF